VEYAHVKLPLTRILGDAHELLDAVAKDGRGRDAIAVRVWKPGGRTLEWAMPWEWEWALDRDGQLAIAQLAARFADDEAAAGRKDADRFSSKFFYKIRERFDLLNPPRARPGHEEEAAIFKDDDALALLAVDYLASGINEGRKLKIKDAEKIIQPLLKQCRPVVRHKKESTVSFSISNRLEADGALLVRFLARKGVETR